MTTEKIVGTANGVFVVQSIRRRPEPQRFDKDLLKQVRGFPWNPNPGPEEARELPGSVPMRPMSPGVPATRTEVFEKATVHRRHYIVRADLEAHGFTAGCPACDDTRAGNPRRGGVVHTDACRARIEKALAQDPERRGRLEATEQRFLERVAADIEKAERPRSQRPPAELNRQEAQTGEPTSAADAAMAEPSRTLRRKSLNDDLPAPVRRQLAGVPVAEGAAVGSSAQGHGNMEVERAVVGSPTPGAASSSSGAGGAVVGSPAQSKAKRGREETDEEAAQVDPRRAEARLDAELIGERSREGHLSSWDAEQDILAAVEEANGLAAEMDAARNPDRPVAEEPSIMEGVAIRVDPWKEYYDTVTGVQLDAELVKQAMTDELAAMEKMKVWRRIAAREVPTGAPVIPTKWVLTNKGDSERMDVRARLVACEVKGAANSEAALFAATPPLDALRCLISLAASCREKVLDFVDVRKAHLNGKARRSLVVKLPKEAGGGMAVLQRALYGTRDAAACWEACVAEALDALGFSQGRSSPCLYHHAGRDLQVFVHGDDFVSLGKLVECRWLRTELSRQWELKERGALGVEEREMRILGRILGVHKWGYSLEADPRHAEILCSGAGLSSSSKGVTTPGVKTEADERPLTDEKATEFRSACMRAAYLSLDRPEILYAVKDMSRRFAAPTAGDLVKLQRLARYLKRFPRLVQKFVWQTVPRYLDIECDSDFAGCSRTRKSTSGFAAFLGEHAVATRSKTQSVIATSTGEAEFYAVVSAISNALGLQSVLIDLGVQTQVRIGMDASAGLGMISRRGLGRAKHIQVQYLWVQQVVANNMVKPHKIRGEDNRSDLMTKHLQAPRLVKLLQAMGYDYVDGQSRLALKAV